MEKNTYNNIRPEWIPSAYREMDKKEISIEPKEETPGLKQDKIAINPASVPATHLGLIIDDRSV